MSFNGETSKQCVFTATIEGFSKPYPSQAFSKCKITNADFHKYFSPRFYRNGDCKENEGYVSIFLLLNKNELISPRLLLKMEFNCTVSVIDTAGYKRFPRCFVYTLDENSQPDDRIYLGELGFHRYLKRETLCNESSELLPDDCLNVHVEVNYLLVFTLGPYSISDNPFDFEAEKAPYIKFDSDFGRRLCEVSEYFHRASVTDMIEKKARRIFFPPEECFAFSCIFFILMKAKRIEIYTVDDIRHMYKVADKYVIDTVIETIRELLKSFLCRINDSNILQYAVRIIPVISELAERYNDESLKEMIAVYLENKKKYGTNERAFEKHVKHKLGTDWICEYNETLKSFYLRLPVKEDNDIEPELEFYK